jgi:hypothetical protein
MSGLPLPVGGADAHPLEAEEEPMTEYDEEAHLAAQIEAAASTPSLTQVIDRLQRRHPGTRRQRSYHGANRYSVQFFDRTTGKLVADYDL